MANEITSIKIGDVEYPIYPNNAHNAINSQILLTNNIAQSSNNCYSESPGLRFWRFNGTHDSGTGPSGGDGYIMSWSWNTGSVGGQIYLDDNPTKTMAIRGRNTTANSWTTWATFLHSENFTSYVTPSSIGAATTSHTHSYLPLSGGTLSGHLSSNSGYTIVQPYGAQYRTTTSTVTGCITVILPASIGNTMVSMWIDVYEYSTQKSFTVHCGGYTYSNSTWANSPFAIVYGATHRVRLGHNGTNFVIYIGETNTVWSYPQVHVRNVTLGYNPTLENWQKTWSINFSTSVQNVTYDTTTYAWTSKLFSTYSPESVVSAGYSTSDHRTGIVPTLNFISYWNGAYNTDNASNLKYCDRGRFGTIITKSTSDYMPAGDTSHGTHVTTGAQTWSGVKTFAAVPVFNSGINSAGSILLSGTDSSTSHIKFSRNSYNYITWPDGYSLAFGKDNGSANTFFRMTNAAFFPETTNNFTLGTSSLKWSNVYATTFTGNLTGNVTGNCSGSSGSCTGNAATATKLKTARSISLSGAVTGSTTFDGSGNVSITTTENDPKFTMSSVITYDYTTRKFSTTKTDNSWNANVYSNYGYSFGCYMSFKPSQTTQYIMVGLNSDPTKDASYTSIDYCWYCQANGSLNIYESGSAKTVDKTTYATGDDFRITYDGKYIRYFCNGTLYRTVERAIGDKLYFDSSFYNAGSIYDVEFGLIPTHVNYANTAGSATTSTKSGDSSVYLYPEYNNEINFGGSNAATTLYFGYRAKDSRPIPTEFIFGGAEGSATLKGNSFKKKGSSDSYVLLGGGGHKAISDFATASHSHDYLPLVGGTMTGAITFNDTATAMIKYGAWTNTGLGSYPLPSLGSNGIGIFARPSKSTDEGGLIITEDTCMIFNSADNGWSFQVHNTDLSQKNFAGTDGAGEVSRVFGIIDSGSYAWSKGGYKKEGSSDSYVLLGGGGHKAISDFATASHTHNFTWNNNNTDIEAILSDLQTQISANASAIQNKSDIGHTHNYYSSTTSRTKNTVLAAPSSANGAATFRALVAADIPSLAASKITSGTFDIARIPTGTTSTTVALGDHTHDGRYYTETEIDTKLDSKADTEHTHEYLPLAGGEMTGSIIYTKESTGQRILYGKTRNSGIKYDYQGNECLIISSGSYNNSSIELFTSNRIALNDSNGQWNATGTIPDVHIKQGCMTINKLLTSTTYNLDVNGKLNATEIYQNGTPLSATDTKNTAGATNTSSKIYLIGATSQAANPQTYSHDTVYVDGGALYSESKKVIVVNSLPSNYRSYYYTDGTAASTSTYTNNTTGTTQGSISFTGSFTSTTTSITTNGTLLKMSGSTAAYGISIPGGYSISATVVLGYNINSYVSVSSVMIIMGYSSSSTGTSFDASPTQTSSFTTKTINVFTNGNTTAKTYYLKGYVASLVLSRTITSVTQYSITITSRISAYKIYKNIPATSGSLPNGSKNIINGSGYIACAPTYNDVFLNLPDEFFIRKGNYCLSVSSGSGIRYSKNSGQSYTPL